MTKWDGWLRQLAAAGKGGIVLEGEAARGLQWDYSFALPGDWTGATVRSQIRAEPDAVGAPLATCTVTGPVVGGGVSVFTLSLAAGSGANSTGALPADTTGDGFVQLPIDVLLAPADGTEERLFGGLLTVVGRITE